jgi:hypothetical protein
MAEFSKPEDINLIWSESGQRRRPSDGKIALGHVKEIPKFQDFNWINGRQDDAIAHFNQMGIAVWDAETEYRASKSYVQGSDGSIYHAKTTNTNVDPTTDTDFSDWSLVRKATDYSLPSVSITPQNSWVVGVSGYFKVKMVNNILYLDFQIEGGTITNGTLIGQLPALYNSPTQTATKNLSALAYNGSTWNPCIVVIETDGDIRISGVVDNDRLICNAVVIM